MSPRRVMFALLTALAVLLLVTAAWGDSHVRIVRLSYVEGDVQIDRADGQGFQSAFLNLPITQGVRLQTHDDGRAEVEFEDGSTLRIAPDSALSFDQLGLRDSGARFTSVILERGTAYFDLRKKGNDEFTIAAGHDEQLELEHNARFRVNVDATGMKLAVFDGEVKFTAPDKSIAVKKNGTLDTDRTNRLYTSNSIPLEPYDSWNVERDQYRKQYGSSATVLSSPYTYGTTDLNYYGNFFNSPYGYLWRPWSATAAWSPFADGAWVYYPRFGYSWVSAYSWGWLPYHYGSWIYYQPYGWCWQPARVWNNWAPLAIIHSPGPGFVVPRPPAAPPVNGGHLIAVGRGPNRGIVHNPRLETSGNLGFEAQGPRSSSVPRPQASLKWPGPTIKLPNGTVAGLPEQERNKTGLFSIAPRNRSLTPIELVAPLRPSTLAPLEPTGPSSALAIHWPPPVMTQPRSVPLSVPRIPRPMIAPHIMSPIRSGFPHSEIPHSSFPHSRR